mmetsp:Transcript_53316/g.62256  ORF Transcript_53316/g.62256 Transcript_53316/m.62256 type:complete len:89 (+) Transcript_53316:209-475(+)
MSLITKAADTVQRAATLGLFGFFVASATGIRNQVKEFQDQSLENDGVPSTSYDSVIENMKVDMKEQQILEARPDRGVRKTVFNDYKED